MSKSVARVRAAATAAGLPVEIIEMPGSTRTAEDAAAACGCTVAQIVKSMIFAASDGTLRLLLTPGDRQVDPALAEAGFGVSLSRADPDQVRAVTGFAIGGVSPIGHMTPVICAMDPELMAHAQVWAAAGTPRHVFSAVPEDLRRASAATLMPFTR
ncbi:MAG: YbaK/EbsC family protein [Pseudomonadota bacterium]